MPYNYLMLWSIVFYEKLHEQNKTPGGNETNQTVIFKSVKPICE